METEDRYTERHPEKRTESEKMGGVERERERGIMFS